MKVSELIELLKEMNQNADVRVGVVFDEEDDEESGEGEEALRLFDISGIDPVETEDGEESVAIIIDAEDEDEYPYDDE